MMVIHGGNSEQYDKALLISDKVSIFPSRWILDFACSYHVYYREELLDFLENSDGTIYLQDGSSYAFKDIGTISLQA